MRIDYLPFYSHSHLSTLRNYIYSSILRGEGEKEKRRKREKEKRRKREKEKKTKREQDTKREREKVRK